MCPYKVVCQKFCFIIVCQKFLIVIASFSESPLHRIFFKIEGREEVDKMEVVDSEREELIERAKWKKKVLVDMVYKAVYSPEKRHCYAMISKIVDMPSGWSYRPTG